jgi:hypothetical protein
MFNREAAQTVSEVIFASYDNRLVLYTNGISFESPWIP